MRTTPLALFYGLAAALAASACGSDEQAKIESFVRANTPSGACLIEYNSALVADRADACCSRLGGANTCDLDVRCNELSGSDCCLFYATDVALSGSSCCRYEDRQAPPFSPEGNDRTAECDALLQHGR